MRKRRKRRNGPGPILLLFMALSLGFALLFALNGQETKIAMLGP